MPGTKTDRLKQAHDKLWTRLEDEEPPRSVGQDSKPGADVAVLVVGDQQTKVAS